MITFVRILVQKSYTNFRIASAKLFPWISRCFVITKNNFKRKLETTNDTWNRKQLILFILPEAASGWSRNHSCCVHVINAKGKRHGIEVRATQVGSTSGQPLRSTNTKGHVAEAWVERGHEAGTCSNGSFPPVAGHFCKTFCCGATILFPKHVAWNSAGSNSCVNEARAKWSFFSVSHRVHCS